MKLTRHNGRSGKHGTYNPRHNDRRFDVENSEHIDAQRAKKNVYWDCYRGFTTPELRENPEQPDFSFEEIERKLQIPARPAGQRKILWMQKRPITLAIGRSLLSRFSKKKARIPWAAFSFA